MNNSQTQPLAINYYRVLLFTIKRFNGAAQEIVRRWTREIRERALCSTPVHARTCVRFYRECGVTQRDVNHDVISAECIKEMECITKVFVAWFKVGAAAIAISYDFAWRFPLGSRSPYESPYVARKRVVWRAERGVVRYIQA